MKAFHLPIALVVLAALMGALSCSSGGEGNGGSEAPPGMLEEPILVRGPETPEGLQLIFATPDLGLGNNRIGFVVTSPRGVVQLPEVEVTSFFYPSEEGPGEEKQRVSAVFRPWPFGTRGLHTTELSFDAKGTWGIEVDVPGPEGLGGAPTLRFPVEEVPTAVDVGSSAVRSDSKTHADVDDISELTTGTLRDEDLYQLTIAEAIDNDLPTVVVMASPAFCTNAVCGPQVDVLHELKEAFKYQANFIHVDLYDNPHEIQGDLDLAVLSPTVLEWRLPSTEWSFVINKSGIVTGRFEGFATLDELAMALEEVL
ncbi:MAG: hypothetical protein J4G01_06030 [Dehalococcoidia bacterium]|nr:hypothetical protein [Dehalococcoidia bacterium]